jgi:hypothetical protein
MIHIIKLPLPDEWYDQFAADAKAQGQTPESLLMAYIQETIKGKVASPEELLSQLDPEDPLRKLAGIISVPVERGWVDKLHSSETGDDTDANAR